VSTTLGQLQVAAIPLVRDLIDDVLRAQTGQVVEIVTPTAANWENQLNDPTAVTALATVRAYFAAASQAGVPPVGALRSKTSPTIPARSA
jgi:hypothetical protein